ncbi:hypothetical protein Dda_5446 [Drechslerella dactyloides]|uniref:Uncharacterized protein n=1 Tax=Drechslerella dactyloides TaxID=74499 RepID=A0AAD6IW38_DREDA|nr:hypothetical protein Dda_5446 [Drechslerella dactyloides]
MKVEEEEEDGDEQEEGPGGDTGYSIRRGEARMTYLLLSWIYGHQCAHGSEIARESTVSTGQLARETERER